MFIEMGDFSVTVERKQIKNINLRIKRTGEVHISAPLKIPISAIQSFLDRKRLWIEKHRCHFLQLEKETPRHFVTGEYINFQGTRYVLQLHEMLTKHRIELSDKQLHLFVKPNTSQHQKELLLTEWYLIHMQQCLPPLFNKWQTAMKVHVDKVSIKPMKSCWGSCHRTKKHITLNLYLIEKPFICLEYVVVHELVHLFEASHNQRFYALMNHYLPNWKQIREQLNQKLSV